MHLLEERWLKEQRARRIRCLIRWATGLPLLLFTFAIPWFGPFLMLLGAILVVPEIVEKISGMADGLLWNRYASPAPPLYGIAETCKARGQYAEAEAEYEKIIRQYPDEVKPHIDLIDIAVTRLGDAALADALYRRGMECLRKPEGRENLTAAYERIRSRLKVRPAS